jgi:hypothetical protein
MKRKLAAAVLVLIAGFACSACGSFLLNGVPSGGSSSPVMTFQTSVTLRAVPVVDQLPLSRSGRGSKSLGPFRVHGNVRMRATCTGGGNITVGLHERSGGGFAAGPVRCKGQERFALDIGSNGVEGVAHITVKTGPQTNWWIDVIDRQPKP